MSKLSNKKIRYLRLFSVFLAAVVLCVAVFGVSALRNAGLQSSLKEVPITVNIKSLSTPKNNAADKTSFTELNPLGENAHKVAENEQLILYIEDDYSGIRVYDKVSGAVWNSVVSDKSVLENPKISDIYKDSMQSFFTFSYVDLSSGSTKLTNTSSSKEETEIEETPIFGGVRLTFVFTKLNITISVDISLENGSLIISVPDDGIKENMPDDGSGANEIDKKIKSANSICTKIKNLAEKNSEMTSSEKMLVDMSIGEVMSSLVNISSQAVSGAVEDLNYENISTNLDTLSIVSIIYDDINDLCEKLKTEVSDLQKLTADASENRSSGLIELSVLPYFGAQLLGTDGYAFYPDGCGAISKFNISHPELSGTYSQRVDDRDRNDASYTGDQDGNTYLSPVTIPVYGLKADNSAFLAIITDGEYDSQINFSPCTVSQNVATVYGSFYIRQMSSIVNSNSDAVSTYDEDRIKSDRTTRYVFLQGENADYSGMAAAYRDYLKETEQLEKSSVMESKEMPLALDFFIGLDTEKNGLTDSYISMTTFSGIETFVKSIEEQGVSNLAVYLDNWKDDNGNSLITGYKASKAAGGKKALKELADYMQSKDYLLTLEGQYAETEENDMNSAERDVAAVKTKSSLNFLCGETALLNPTYLYNRITKLGINSLGELGVNAFDMGDMSRSLYFDYNEAAVCNRSETAKIFSQIANEISDKNYGLVGQNANAYLYSVLAWNREVPETDSGFLYTDEAIPFVQMILHGNMVYTGTPFNDVYDERQQLLKAVEYGYIPSYYLTEKSPLEISTAGLQGFYSTEYSVWESEICDTYKSFNKDLGEVWNQIIVKHEKLSDDVYSVSYENGISIIVNYGTEEITVDGIQIDALGYRLVKS